MLRAPHNPQPPPKADFSTVESVQRALVDASDTLASMTSAVATARTIKEFSGDRRKRALAVPMREFIVAGESAAAAETKARASAIYGEALGIQQQELETAERAIAEWESARIKWESARSCLSSLRAIASNV